MSKAIKLDFWQSTDVGQNFLMRFDIAIEIKLQNYIWKLRSWKKAPN